jgi:hypothetical protein
MKQDLDRVYALGVEYKRMQAELGQLLVGRAVLGEASE